MKQFIAAVVVLEPFPRAIKRFVHVNGGGDQAEMGVCLWEVPEHFPVHPDLLGVESQVIGKRKNSLQH